MVTLILIIETYDIQVKLKAIKYAFDIVKLLQKRGYNRLHIMRSKACLDTEMAL